MTTKAKKFKKPEPIDGWEKHVKKVWAEKLEASEKFVYYAGLFHFMFGENPELWPKTAHEILEETTMLRLIEDYKEKQKNEGKEI